MMTRWRPSALAAHRLAGSVTARSAYSIRRSPRARRVRVRVEHDGAVEVVLPRRAASARPPRRCASCGRGSSGASPSVARARAELGRARRDGALPRRARSTLVPEPGRTRAHRRGDALLVPAGTTRARRSSAGTGAPRARRSRRASTRRAARAGTRLRAADDPRPAHALGLVLGDAARWLQLAAAARARARARLRRLARGLPPRRARPLAALLGAARARTLPGLPRAARWLRRYGATLHAVSARRRRGSPSSATSSGSSSRSSTTLPAPGEIVHAPRDASSSRPAAARSPRCSWRRLAGAATFFTALGDDEHGRARRRRAARAHGVERARAPLRAEPHAARVHVPRRRPPSGRSRARRPRVVPHGADAAAVGAARRSSTASTSPAATPRALRAARAARVLVATPRAIDGAPRGRRRARRARRQRARCAASARRRATLDPRAALVVLTAARAAAAGRRPTAASGRLGGGAAARAPVDAYGCGDCVRRRPHLRRSPPGMPARRGARARGALRRALPHRSRPLRRASSGRAG